jgi:hypothetical protein
LLAVGGLQFCNFGHRAILSNRAAAQGGAPRTSGPAICGRTDERTRGDAASP